MTKLLEGQVLVGDDPGAHATSELVKRIKELQVEVRTWREHADTARREADNATRALAVVKRQLQPLYTSLQFLFGELEAVPVEAAGGGSSVSNSLPNDVPAAAGIDPRVAAVWAQWKAKLGKGPATIIDALMLHGGMNIAQIAIVTGYNRNTVPQYLADLNRAGLLRKADGKNYLKELA